MNASGATCFYLGKSRRAGFTLIEILFSAGLMVALSGLVFVLAAFAMDRSASVLEESRLKRRVSLVFEVLEHDLHNAIFHHDDQHCLTVFQSSQGEGASSHVTSISFTSTGSGLMFDAKEKPIGVPQMQSIVYWTGSPNEVLTDGVEEPLLPGLFRSVIGPVETLQKYGETICGHDLRSFILSRKSEPPVLESRILPSLIGMEIILFNRSNQIIINTGTPFMLPSQGQQHPASIEIILTALSDRGQKQLRGLQSGELTGLGEKDILSRHGRVFRRRIQFLSSY